MAKFYQLFFTMLFTSGLVAAQSPDSTNAPKIWLRGDRGAIKEDVWSDQSGHKLDATAKKGQAPSLNGSLNFNPVVSFDGIDDYMQIPFNLEELPGITMMAVFSSSDTTERGIWGAENGSSRDIFLSTRKAKGPEDVVDNYGKNEKTFVLNSVVQNWTETENPVDNAFIALGSSGSKHLNKPYRGSVAELLIYDRALDFSERVQVETYLAIKYGVGLKEGNYLSSGRHVLWKTEDNKAFGSRIAGIGRDDAFILYQKQSISAFDSAKFLTISVGAPAPANKENKSVLQDGEFLVWGDNGLKLTEHKGEGKDSVLSFIDRKWLMAATGTTIRQTRTIVSFNVNLLPKTELGYWLVIDRSGTGDFSVDSLEYINAKSISNDGIAAYEVQWDTDISGKDAFALVRAKNMFAVVRALNSPLCNDLDNGKVKVEVMGGKGPFYYTLKKDKDKDFFREWNGQKEVTQSALSVGDYQIVIKDAEGTRVVRFFSLRMWDELKINLGPDQQFAAGKEIQLDATTSVPDSIPVTYTWSSNFGFENHQGKITVNEPGLYRVAVTNAKGCVFTDDVAIGGSEEKRFNVFPTMVEEGKEFTIGISLPESGNVSVVVYDMKGNVLQQNEGKNSSEYLFTGKLKDPGMYMISLQSPQGIETQKVVAY